jgi:predicted Fe-S protein YdhL (DUF1289 family)
MFIYGKEHFCKAHTAPHINACFDLTTRDVICSDCLKFIGEQTRWEVYDNRKFEFYDEREKNKYNFCPYCGAAK